MLLSEFLKEVGGEKEDMHNYYEGNDALECVKRDGNNIRYVPIANRTDKIRKAAVKDEGSSIVYILPENRTFELRKLAIEDCVDNLQYIFNQTIELVLFACKQNYEACIEYVDITLFENDMDGMIDIDGKKFSKETIKEALKAYANFDDCN